MKRILALLLCGSLLSVTGLALELTSMERRADAYLWATNDHYQQNVQFSDHAGPFDVFVTAQVSAPPATVVGHAVQASWVTDTHIYGSGEATLTSTNPSAAGGQTSSYMMVTFAVAEPTAIRIAGTLESKPGTGPGIVTIERGYEWSWKRYAEDGLVSFDETLVLSPGDYLFSAYVTVLDSSGPSPHSIGWNVDFSVVPEPAGVLALLMPAVLLRRPGK